MSKILVIEDEGNVREIIFEMLTAEGFQVIEAEDGRVGIRLAIEQMPDLIICDILMPEVDGYSVLRQLRQNPSTETIPFIFLTAKADKMDMRQGMNLGADDYLTKPFTRDELLEAVMMRLKKNLSMRQHYAVLLQQVEKSYTTQLYQAQEKMNYLLYHDPLTNLPNQLSLQEQFDGVLTQMKHSSFLMPILCLSVDRFNELEAILGYEFGDLLIQAAADRLTSCIGNENFIAHLNTDEFAIILAPVPHTEVAATVAETILYKLSKPLLVDNREIFISASIGISLYPRDGRQLGQLLQNSKKAMNEARRERWDKYKFYSAFFKKLTSDEFVLETDLRYALERKEFEVHYQPQVNLQSGQIVGAEALLRWHHPERGQVSPTQFIPLAEETNLISSIGEWVLRNACQQTKTWHDSGLSSMRIAVNLSVRQFNQPDLLERLVQILIDTGLDPQHLELELTESSLVENPQVAIARLNALKALGIRVAIDDFGTGYSSLSYLQQFSCDVLKIDQRFVRNINNNGKKKAIVNAISVMAHQLHLTAIAEGVETTEELAVLRQHNCDEVQGYLFSRPLPVEDFEKLVASGKIY